MTYVEMRELKKKYGNALDISKAVHLHDEDDWNEYTISYNGVIVGSELVSKPFVENNIKQYCTKT